MPLSRRQLWVGGSLGIVALTSAGVLSWRLSCGRLPPPGLTPDMALGAPNAPVTLILYGSPSCPHCARFFALTLPDLKRRYIDGSVVRFIYREFPLNTLDTAATLLLRGVPHQKFFPLLEEMLRTQESWTAARDGEDFLKRLAAVCANAGISRDAFDRCMSDKTLAGKIDAARALAASYGIMSTPTAFINDRQVVGFKSADDMREMIDPLVAIG